jgi:formimidoylglutamate deiminase
VLLTFDERGTLLSVKADQEPGEHERASGIVVPGIPNLHSHAFQRALAGRTERSGSGPDTFWTWREAMYRFLEVLAPRDVEVIAAMLYVEMLKAGYTSVGEFHYLHHARLGRPYVDPDEISNRVLESAQAVGIRMTFLPVVYETGGFRGEPLNDAQRRFRLGPAEALEAVERLRAGARRSNRTAVGLALHSLRGVHEQTIRSLFGAAGPEVVGPVHIHAAEQVREVRECVAVRGARPVRWLLDHAGVDPAWCLVHCTHLDEGEVSDLAGSGAVVSLCPSTEGDLGDGLFPLESFLSAGGRFGIGSDSHVSVSPVEELRWLEYAQRATHLERNVGAGEEESTATALLRRVWDSGSRAMGQRVGRLEEGYAADFLVLDPDGWALGGHDSATWLDAWVFSAHQSPRDVMVGGRWVVRNGGHPAEEAVRSRYIRTMRELTKRL